MRIDQYGKNYKFDRHKEDYIWRTFYKRIGEMKESFVVDNTNCRLLYINKIKESLPKDFHVEYVFFHTPLWKLHIRNVLRWWKTGKWIPVKVINQMKANFNDTIQKITL